jgi:tight adherence protein B
MFYLLLFCGLFFLILMNINWRRAQRKLAGEGTTARKAIPPLIWLQKRLREWRSYAIKEPTLKGARNLIIAIVLVVVILGVNSYWFKFDLLTLIPTLLVLAFWMQISIGRSLRRRYFEERFPEVLSVVGAAVSAGNSLHQALGRCGENVEGELGEIFHRVDRRLNLGEEPERVFNDAWEQFRYREFYFFNVVMLVSLQRGGQLKVLISRLSRMITNSKTLARRKKAMTSEARMSAKIVAGIPMLFFFGMKFLQPENFDFIIHDSTGRIILYYVLASEMLGIGIIWGLLKKAL